uniref:Uncharacterized protein n=1 Tax=Arundo donax TaxID=35708 RepID=A0A0A9EAP5_ARUDO
MRRRRKGSFLKKRRTRT